MPVSIPGIMGALIPSLTAVGMIGSDIPKYARGVAIGLVRWVPQIKVSTVDTGSAGSGKNIPQPFLVPSPLLYGNLISSMVSQDLVGVFMPVFITGLSTGLSVAFLQMLIVTNHPSVGAGTGVARFTAPPATNSMAAGFAAAGLNGNSAPQKVRALGLALDRTLASLIMPVAIVGPGSPSPSTGTGVGKIQ